MARQSCHDWLMYWLQAHLIPVMLAAWWTGYLYLQRPDRKFRHHAPQQKDVRPAPERREPRDMIRPYPKRVIVGPDDERLTTCPVCGMEDPLFLDGGPWQGSFFGWPAHATCVEWIGTWRPPSANRLELIHVAPKVTGGGWPFRLPSTGQRAANPGGTAITIPAPGVGTIGMRQFGNGMERLVEAVRLGHVSLDEARGMLACSEPPTWTVTSAGRVACDCGMQFAGARDAVVAMMDAHSRNGEHESEKYGLR